MKRTLALILACALALTALAMLSGCASADALDAEPITVSEAEKSENEEYLPTVYAALSGFGLNTLKSARTEGEDTLLSPLSIALALSMAANGAEGETLAQFEAVLGGGTSLDALNAACASLTEAYEALGGSTEASIANSVWLDPDGEISDTFVGKCTGIFDAEVYQEELSDFSIVSKVNGWVSDKTNGLIPKILSDACSEDAAALLVNALYLKNTWASEFDPNDTAEFDFTHADGSTERVEYLTKESHLSYVQGDGVQGVVLPYDDGRLAFAAFLPDEAADGNALSVWLDSLEGDELSDLVLNAEGAYFELLRLPKFETEWNAELSEVLSGLGLDAAFDAERADFSALGDSPYGYYISSVIHAAKLEVNEKGTEAAAATVVTMDEEAAMIESEGGVRLVFNRPFVYGIFDLETGVPLFLGTYE